MNLRNGTWRLVANAGMLALALSACASQPQTKPANRGDVDFKPVVDMGVPRYTIKRDQAATDVKPLDHTPPIYPAEYVDLGLPPRDVRVKVIVNDTGDITEVRSGDAGVRDPIAMAFFNAVVAAVGNWHYQPLLITDWVEDPDGSTHRVAAKAVPFSIDYIFHFEVVKGIPQVDETKLTGTDNSKNP